MEKIQIKVKGMTCGGCQSAVRRALSGVAGVSKAQVDLAGGVATVEYDAAKAALPELHKAVVKAGFQVG
ncbi:MAG: heavy-metal-associated domain-containing protein [Candidatus Tectomicrobia bacterium]|nr:heavy-metal-associated domain-containing protein [Candidatus Tectomicrobia bacterium]